MILMLDLSCQLSSVQRNIPYFYGGGSLMMYRGEDCWFS
jgi:hypothetical protein